MTSGLEFKEDLLPFVAYSSLSPKYTRLLYFLVILALFKLPGFYLKGPTLFVEIPPQDTEDHTLSALFGHQGTAFSQW